MNLIGCISLEGQSLLVQASALEGGQMLSLAELNDVASVLVAFVGRLQGEIPHPLVGGDIRLAGKTLGLLTQQFGYLMAVIREGEGLASVDSLARAASHLLNPDLFPAWVGVVEGVEFDTSNFLQCLESLLWVIGDYLNVTHTLPMQRIYDNLLIRTESIQSHDFALGSRKSLVLSFNDSMSTISLDALNGVTPPSLVTVGLFPTLQELLPLRAPFNISHMTIATPILSIQAADAEGSSFTGISVNLTLQFIRTLVHEDVVGGAVCVSWTYEGR